MNWANAANSEVRLTITCGIDWAGSHHDVALVDGTGKLVAKRRISDDAEGLRRLLDLLTEAGDTAGDPIPVPVEAARGLLISCLRATGRAVYSINPMAVARYRERHRVSCSPSRGQRCTERSPAAEPARRSDPALLHFGSASGVPSPPAPPRPLEAAEPLTDADRAELTRRQAKAAYWAEVSARQRAANGMVGW
jgi:hypothetical protein